jgi:hypothetical protein
LIGSRRLRRASWAIWLAVAALGLNAFLPIHLALDVGEALGAAREEAPAGLGHDFEWRILALVTGHDAGDARPHGDRHHASCPALAALAALAGFAVAMPPALPAPAAVEARPARAALAALRLRIPSADYRSRAPPGT